MWGIQIVDPGNHEQLTSFYHQRILLFVTVINGFANEVCTENAPKCESLSPSLVMGLRKKIKVSIQGLILNYQNSL